jgi:hypothetical protein
MYIKCLAQGPPEYMLNKIWLSFLFIIANKNKSRQACILLCDNFIHLGKCERFAKSQVNQPRIPRDSQRFHNDSFNCLCHGHGKAGW